MQNQNFQLHQAIRRATATNSPILPNKIIETNNNFWFHAIRLHGHYIYKYIFTILMARLFAPYFVCRRRVQLSHIHANCTAHGTHKTKNTCCAEFMNSLALGRSHTWTQHAQQWITLGFCGAIAVPPTRLSNTHTAYNSNAETFASICYQIEKERRCKRRDENKNPQTTRFLLANHNGFANITDIFDNIDYKYGIIN